MVALILPGCTGSTTDEAGTAASVESATTETSAVTDEVAAATTSTTEATTSTTEATATTEATTTTTEAVVSTTSATNAPPPASDEEERQPDIQEADAALACATVEIGYLAHLADGEGSDAFVRGAELAQNTNNPTYAELGASLEAAVGTAAVGAAADALLDQCELDGFERLA